MSKDTNKSVILGRNHHGLTTNQKKVTFLHGHYTERMIQADNTFNQRRQTSENYGNGRYTNDGTRDRILGKPPVIDNCWLNADKQGYLYGYYNRGNKALKIMATTGDYDGVTPESLKSTNNNSNEYWKHIGINDVASGVEIEKLPEVIRSNEDYKRGLEIGKLAQKVIKGEINIESLPAEITNDLSFMQCYSTLRARQEEFQRYLNSLFEQSCENIGKGTRR